MNYNIIYQSICNQITKKYLSEANPSSIEPVSSLVDDPIEPSQISPSKTDPISPTSPSEPKPQHLGDPNFHQFPISPEGMPIQVWVFNPFPFPGSFQLFGWNGQQYNPIGQPVPQTYPNTQQLPNQNVPVVLPYGFPNYFPQYLPNPMTDPAGAGDKWPGKYLNNPLFGPSNPPDPGDLDWPPGFNPYFWSPEHFLYPPGYGVKPNYPVMSPDINDPYGPATPNGMPPPNRPGMRPGGIAPYRPHDPDYDPQNPFARPGIPVVADPSRPLPPPRPPRKPSDIFYGVD